LGGLKRNEEKKVLSSSHSSEYWLDLKNEEYTIEIKVKGEDRQKYNSKERENQNKAASQQIHNH
jgi:hypothetical protein